MLLQPAVDILKYFTYVIWLNQTFPAAKKAYLENSYRWTKATPRPPGPPYDLGESEPMEKVYFNGSTYSQSIHNLTQHGNPSNTYWPNYFQQNCKGKPWNPGRRWDCFWNFVKGFCRGPSPVNIATRMNCPWHCRLCPALILEDYKEVGKGEDKYGKAIDGPLCGDAKLANLGPSAKDKFLSTSKLSWKKAYFCCKENGLELMSDIGDDHLPSLKRYFGGAIKNLTWVFLSDATRENNWMWPGMRKVKRGSFVDGQPNNRGEQNCGAAFFYDKQFWLDDRKCDEELRFICQQGLISGEYFLDRKFIAPSIWKREEKNKKD